MVETEREMVRKLSQPPPAPHLAQERFTSLQPTYEDSVPPSSDDWEHERDYGS